MDEPVEEVVGENEEVENQQCADCSYGHYPDFCMESNNEQMAQGAAESSYILGFVATLNQLELSEGSLMDIIRMKISPWLSKRITSYAIGKRRT